METKLKNVLLVLEEMGEFFIEKYKGQLQKSNSIATGTLLNSVDYRIEVKEDSLKMYFIAPDKYRNKNTEEWFIEVGRKAGSKPPPIDVIRKWIQIKNIQPREGTTKEGLPYALQRGIAKNGIRPKPFIRNAKIQTILNFKQKLEKAFKKDMEDVLELTIKPKTINSKSMTTTITIKHT